jgi:hypothetical protein
VIGTGPELQQSLGVEPDTVQVELMLGQYVYMLEFGGEQQQFQSGQKLLRKQSSRPSICPSDGTSAP